MALVRWNQSGKNVALNSRDDWECFLEDLYAGRFRRGQERQVYSPRVDVIDNTKEFVLRADLPGLDKGDIDISVNNDTVIIKGERKDDALAENECFFCRETSFGAFERTVALPDKVLVEEAKASLNNGVLTLTIPKTEPTGSVKIEVN